MIGILAAVTLGGLVGGEPQDVEKDVLVFNDSKGAVEVRVDGGPARQIPRRDAASLDLRSFDEHAIQVTRADGHSYGRSFTFIPVNGFFEPPHRHHFCVVVEQKPGGNPRPGGLLVALPPAPSRRVIAAEDAEAIERATLRALPPRVLETDDGWLLCANDGVISRANSVVPFGDGLDRLDAKIDRAITFYDRQGLKPAFRVSPFSRPSDLSEALAARGFTPGMTTQVMTMPNEGHDNRALSVALTSSTDPSWRALFIAPGFGASEADIRIETLSRGEGTRFASLAANGEVVAIGAGSLSGAWVGVHGMRTKAEHRGIGYAAAILYRLLADARDRGAERAFLQVEESNRDAMRLYERLGFSAAYAYDYWRRP